jgi:YHS domain-containing protein
MALSRRSMLWIVPGATVAVPLGTLLLAGRGLAAQVNADGGVAVRGTDVVAYVTEGRPVAGSARFTHAWRGATWRFASAANRDRFAADPERYAPAYGGFCAYAVSEGYTAPIDPAAWRIVDGRLYLNYDRSVQRRWEADIPGRIARADANWPALAAR